MGTGANLHVPKSRVSVHECRCGLLPLEKLDRLGCEGYLSSLAEA
jgi:hypothetical protein